MLKLVLLLMMFVVVVVECEDRNCLVENMNTGQPGWVRYHDGVHACVSCRDSPFNEYSTNVSRIFNISDDPRCCTDRQQLVLKGENCSNGDVIVDVTRHPCANESECPSRDVGAATECEFFACEMGANRTRCLPQTQTCDGIKDCENGEDEIGCRFHRGICPGFLCPSPHSRCLQNSKVCDGHKDCVDGSDERNCQYCPHQFRCESFFDNTTKINSAECYNPKRVCDGIVDCKNGEDEKNCFRWTEWAVWSASCTNSTVRTRERTRDCVDRKKRKVASNFCFGSNTSATNSTQQQQVEDCYVETTTAQQATTQLSSNDTTTTTSSGDSVATATTFEASTAVRPTPGEEEQSTVVGNNPTTRKEERQTFISTFELTTTTLGLATNNFLSQHFHGLSLNVQIILLAVAILLAFLLLIFVIFYVIEKKRHSGKWSPRVQAASGQLPMPVRTYTNHGFESEEERQRNKAKRQTTRSADSAFSEEAEAVSSDDKTNENSDGGVTKTEYSTSTSLPLPPAEFLKTDYESQLK